MADLSNYSMHDLLQEWIMDRARAPILLQRAVELEGIDAVIAYAVENGVPRGTIMFALRKAGCVQSTPKDPSPSDEADAVRRKLRKLWRDHQDTVKDEITRLFHHG